MPDRMRVQQFAKDNFENLVLYAISNLCCMYMCTVMTMTVCNDALTQMSRAAWHIGCTGLLITQFPLLMI